MFLFAPNFQCFCLPLCFDQKKHDFVAGSTWLKESPDGEDIEIEVKKQFDDLEVFAVEVATSDKVRTLKKIVMNIWITNINQTSFFKKMVELICKNATFTSETKVSCVQYIAKIEHEMTVAQYNTILYLENVCFNVYRIIQKKDFKVKDM